MRDPNKSIDICRGRLPAAFLSDPGNRIQNSPAKTHEAAFEMLDAGRGDYLLDYSEAAVAEGLKKHPIENVRGDVLDVVQMYLVISKSYPDAAGIHEIGAPSARIRRSARVR